MKTDSEAHEDAAMAQMKRLILREREIWLPASDWLANRKLCLIDKEKRVIGADPPIQRSCGHRRTFQVAALNPPSPPE